MIKTIANLIARMLYYGLLNIWHHSLAARTSASHAEDRSSILRGATKIAWRTRKCLSFFHVNFGSTTRRTRTACCSLNTHTKACVFTSETESKFKGNWKIIGGMGIESRKDSREVFSVNWVLTKNKKQNCMKDKKVLVLFSCKFW